MFVVFAGLNAASVMAPRLLGSYWGNLFIVAMAMTTKIVVVPLLLILGPSFGPEDFKAALIAVALSLDLQMLYFCNSEWQRVSQHKEQFFRTSGRIFYGALTLMLVVSMAVLFAAL